MVISEVSPVRRILQEWVRLVIRGFGPNLPEEASFFGHGSEFDGWTKTTFDGSYLRKSRAG
jgi:hypothetical protein